MIVWNMIVWLCVPSPIPLLTRIQCYLVGVMTGAVASE
jgi:hypothetical protein